MAHQKNEVDSLLKARAEIDEQLRRHKSILTVLFTDVVGSTGFFERNGDTAGLAMIHRHDKLATSVVQKHGGRVVKTIGDSAMAEFTDPASAVRAGVEIQRQFLKLNLTLAENDLVEIRIGIHNGVGYRKGDDLFGDVVNVAARIVKRSAPAQILVSRSVYEAVSEEIDLHCQWLSKVTIDGRVEKEDLFEAAWTDAEAYRAVRERQAGPAGIPSRFEVLSQIGSGGVGVVYKVRDLETDEILALKVLKSEIACDPDVQENFKRELCLSRKITHKNVCRLYDFGRSSGLAYASMEFVDGESLLSRLSRGGALSASEASEIALQICAGLREAHAQGIVHRDLKPANIMLDRTGAVKIMDFGVARLIGGNSPKTGTIVGTPAYMAPEQAELKPVGTGTDIYALGLVFYEMITGVPAFSGDTPVAVALKQIREYPKRPREIVPKLAAPIEAVILKCIQKDAASRFRSVDELEGALQRAMKARPIPAWQITVERCLRKAESEGRRILNQSFAVMDEFVKRQGRRVPTRIHKKAAAVLVMPALLGGVIAFAMHRSDKNNAKPSQATSISSASRISQVSSAGVQAENFPTTKSASIEISNDVDLNRNFNNDATGTKPSITDASMIENLGIDPVKPPSAHSPESQPTKHEKAPVRTAGRKIQAKQQSPATSKPAPGTSADQVLTAAVMAQPIIADGPSNPPKQQVVSAGPVGETGAPAVAPRSVDPGPKSQGHYFEVGSFKDETWANAAVEKLTQLGFHAVTMHKNLLWSQSYHVEVGPYSDPRDVEAARQTLSAQGFKMHPVK